MKKVHEDYGVVAVEILRLHALIFPLAWLPWE